MGLTGKIVWKSHHYSTMNSFVQFLWKDRPGVSIIVYIQAVEMFFMLYYCPLARHRAHSSCTIELNLMNIKINMLGW